MCGKESSCGCSTVTIDNAPVPTEAEAGFRNTYVVSGMTCGGCAKTVTHHVTDIAGVTDVQADVPGGTITVLSVNPLETADIRAAVERAGYQLVS